MSVKDLIVETVRDCIKELLNIDLITAYQWASSDKAKVYAAIILSLVG